MKMVFSHNNILSTREKAWIDVALLAFKLVA